MITRGIKAVLRPLLRPLLLRLDAPVRTLQPQLDALDRRLQHIDAAIGRLDAAHGTTAGRVQDLEHHSAHDKTLIAALREENANLVRGWLRLRTDLLRVQQSVDAKAEAGQGDAPTRWVRVAPAALARLAGRPLHLQVHLSRNSPPAEHALNVAAQERAGVDLIADLAALPFAPGSVDGMGVAGSADDVDPALLAHWRALLRPGAALDFARPG